MTSRSRAEHYDGRYHDTLEVFNIILLSIYHTILLRDLTLKKMSWHKNRKIVMQFGSRITSFFFPVVHVVQTHAGEASAVLRSFPKRPKVSGRYVKIAIRISQGEKQENSPSVPRDLRPVPSNADSPSPPTPTGDRASPTPSAPASRATPWRLVFPSTACIPHLRPGPQTSVSFAFLRCARRQAGDLRSPVVGSLPEGNPLFTRPSCSSGRPSRKEAGADGFPISLPQQQIPLFAR